MPAWLIKKRKMFCKAILALSLQEITFFCPKPLGNSRGKPGFYTLKVKFCDSALFSVLSCTVS